MVTLHILQLLADNGFGAISGANRTLFYEKLPLDKKGVAIFSRGTPLSRGSRDAQSFDLYSRGESDLLGADKLEKIKEWFDNNFTLCDLPLTAKSNKLYKNATIEVISNVENLGLDENDRVIFRLAAVVNYNI